VKNTILLHTPDASQEPSCSDWGSMWLFSILPRHIAFFLCIIRKHSHFHPVSIQPMEVRKRCQMNQEPVTNLKRIDISRLHVREEYKELNIHVKNMLWILTN